MIHIIDIIALSILTIISFAAGFAIAIRRRAEIELQNLALKDDLRAIIAHADDLINSPKYSENKAAELLSTIEHANANLILMDQEQQA